MSELVYLVTQIDLLDREMTIAAFSTHEKAVEYITKRGLEDADVDFVLLDPES